MNRYPLWKYLLIAFTIVLAVIYTLPNLYGVTPAIQISTNRQSITIDSNTEKTVADALQKANIQHGGMFIAGGSLKVRVSDATKISARDAIDAALGEGYIVAQNQIANSPEWLEKIGAKPMFLGLDLRGGVVPFQDAADMQKALPEFAKNAGRRANQQQRQRDYRGAARRAAGANPQRCREAKHHHAA